MSANITPPFMAFFTRDGAEIVMIRGGWRQRVPAADLAKWVGLYRRLWSRQRNGVCDGKTPGPWAPYYADAVETLEKLNRGMAK